MTFLPFIQTNNFETVSAIDTVGALSVFEDENSKIYIGIPGKNKIRPLRASNGKKQIKSSKGKWSLLVANKQAGVSKIAEQNNKTQKLRVTELTRRGNEYVLSPESLIYEPGSKDFEEQETFFAVQFDKGDAFSYSNYWSQNKYYQYLWGLSNTGENGGGNAVAAFSTYKTPDENLNIDSGQNLVSVLDTGVRRTHEDIISNIWINSNESTIPDGIDSDNNGYVDDRNGIRFLDNGSYVTTDTGLTDDNGHGSHVAGTIGALANRNGVIGTNPKAKIMSIGVFGSDGRGLMSNVANGIYYAAIMGSKVINMSLGGGYSQSVEEMMRKASSYYDCLFVVAAGNDNNNNDINPDHSYPATLNLDSIISVAASTYGAEKASFSNYGKQSVDLFAPGSGILSLSGYGNSSYTTKNGTSMATPFVAGAVSSYWGRNIDSSAMEVKSRLLSTVYPGEGFVDSLTGGVIDMGAFTTGISTVNTNGLDLITSAEEIVVKDWENEFEIDPAEIDTFPEQDITNTVFAKFSTLGQRRASRGKIFDRLKSQKGVFGYIENVQLYDKLSPGFVSFSFLEDLPLGRSHVLKQLFEKGIFESIELNQPVSII